MAMARRSIAWRALMKPIPKNVATCCRRSTWVYGGVLVLSTGGVPFELGFIAWHTT